MKSTTEYIRGHLWHSIVAAVCYDRIAHDVWNTVKSEVRNQIQDSTVGAMYGRAVMDADFPGVTTWIEKSGANNENRSREGLW